MKNKVIFCNITWMKDYDGNRADKPQNGGKYIKEYGNGGETRNFLPYNHYCYGYVMHYGQIHIEKYDDVFSNQSEMRNTTVIWVARKPNGRSVIVGWYRNATVYREPGIITDGNISLYDKDGSNIWQYDIKVKEEDAYLLPADKRNFVMPRAQIVGQGKGMGRSNIWYAESEYAQTKIVPEVLKYIDENEKYCKKIYFDKKEISKMSDKTNLSVEQLLKKANNASSLIEALEYSNLALKKKYCYKTLMLRGIIFENLLMYDEAIEEYNCAYFEVQEDLECVKALMYLYIMTFKYNRAVDMAIEILEKESDKKEKCDTMISLIAIYVEQDQLSKAEKVIEQYKSIEHTYRHDDVENFKNYIDELKKN